MNALLLSFDLEEFDIPLEFGQPVEEDTQLAVTVEGMERVAELLESLQIRATFFTTAFFAQKHPEWIKRLAARHEIASHGFHHSRFEVEDLLRSRQVLAELSGQPVSGFRRARFAPTPVAAVAAAGYAYHSSENPIWLPGRYNHWHKPRRPYQQEGLWQIPVSASPWVRFPFFWLSFKNAPLGVYEWFSRRTVRHDGVLNWVFHPWEFADLRAYQLPRYVKSPDGEKLTARLRSHLQRLADEGEWRTFTEYVQTLRS